MEDNEHKSISKRHFEDKCEQLHFIISPLGYSAYTHDGWHFELSEDGMLVDMTFQIDRAMYSASMHSDVFCEINDVDTLLKHIEEETKKIYGEKVMSNKEYTYEV